MSCLRGGRGGGREGYPCPGSVWVREGGGIPVLVLIGGGERGRRGGRVWGGREGEVRWVPLSKDLTGVPLPSPPPPDKTSDRTRLPLPSPRKGPGTSEQGTPPPSRWIDACETLPSLVFRTRTVTTHYISPNYVIRKNIWTAQSSSKFHSCTNKCHRKTKSLHFNWKSHLYSAVYNTFSCVQRKAQRLNAQSHCRLHILFVFLMSPKRSWTCQLISLQLHFNFCQTMNYLKQFLQLQRIYLGIIGSLIKGRNVSWLWYAISTLLLAI